MLLANLSRLALVGCLLSIITALILPRRHNLARILQDILPEGLLVYLSQLTTAIHDHQEVDGELARSRPQDIIREPPRYSGQILQRRTSSTEFRRKPSSSLPAYGYFVPTTESSFHSTARFPSADQLTGAGGYGAGQRPATATQPAISLTVFTVTVVALILYTSMKMLTTRFAHQQLPKGFPLGNQSHFCKSNLAQGLHDKAAASGAWKPDTRQARKLTRLSKDERARQLILYHGPKNVSQAIKFLTAELEKQRHELASQDLSENQTQDNLSPPCSCICHHHQQCSITNPPNHISTTSKDTPTNIAPTFDVTTAHH